MRTHTGGCHCGRVRFEVMAPAKLEVVDCNCSICNKFGYLHLIVPADRFKLISGREALSTYSFNTHVAKHYFCSTCGVKSFYIPRSHPDGVSVNARCIDSDTVESISVTPFNGQDWEIGRAEYRDATDT
ncbi:MAG TPA: GFA family protein [Steroidobacteraceae bacterium]